MKDFFNFPIAVQVTAMALTLLFFVILYIGIKPVLFTIFHWFKSVTQSESLRISDEDAIKIDKAHAEADALKHFEKDYNRNGLQID